MSVLVFLFVGAISGWLASLLVKGSGLGLLGDIVLGVLGGLLSGWLFGQVLHLSLGHGLLAEIASSALGAVLLLLVIRLLRKA